MLAPLKNKLLTSVGPDPIGRLKAWWDGAPYVPGEAPAHEAEARDGAVAASLDLAAHLHISQLLWGRGFTGPGDEAAMVAWGDNLALNKEKSVAFLGVGLGGAARAICKAHEAWITGYDRLPDQIELGTEQCVMAGMAKKVTISPLKIGEVELAEGKFQAIIAKEELAFHEDRGAVFQAIAKGLRPGGLVILTDYLQGEDAAPSGCFLPVWGEAMLGTSGEYEAAINASGLDLRVNEPVTDEYVSAITEAWAKYRALMKAVMDETDDAVLRATYALALGQEADMWANRLEALQAGTLAVHRFVLMKPA
ncbi:MAG: class I SAM-dependent methyltransferase [Pseudomonadota bacterium]